MKHTFQAILAVPDRTTKNFFPTTDYKHQAYKFVIYKNFLIYCKFVLQ
jgi:hypothetical protein